MINELAWDSIFFNRKIGELKASRQPFPKIEAALKKAKAEGFQYLICKIKSQNPALIRFLESSGFYLSDIGITWEIKTAKFSYEESKKNMHIEKSIRVATEKDIPMLKKTTKSLFPESRFYNDPFFSKEEADSLYLTWIENSVKGQAADIVFCVPSKGFVTCKRSDKDSGEIVLIGVKKNSRSKGIGTALVEEAMRWFTTQGLNSVSVRTQLRNLDAMNFYLKLGFTIREYDIIFAKIL